MRMPVDPVIEQTAEIVKRSKQLLVHRDGIGAEIAPVIIAFDGNSEMIGFAQISHPAKTLLDKYRRIAAAAYIMRTTWHAKKIVIVMESYVAKRNLGDPAPEAKDLAVRYANGDKSVNECLSVIGHDANGTGYAMTIPYTIGLGRIVDWIDDVAYSDSGSPVGAYPVMLAKLMTEVEEMPISGAVPIETTMLGASYEIYELGFFVTCDAAGEGQNWLDEIQYGNNNPD